MQEYRAVTIILSGLLSGLLQPIPSFLYECSGTLGHCKTIQILNPRLGQSIQE